MTVDDPLVGWTKVSLVEMSSSRLRKYLKALQRKSGLYLRAYRSVNERKHAVEQELERRK